MPNTPVTTFIDRRIDAILVCPEAWGGLLEAELQVLLALEIRAVAREKEDQVSQVGARFGAHIDRAIPCGPEVLPLAHRVVLRHRLGEFSEILRGFVTQERAVQDRAQ